MCYNAKYIIKNTLPSFTQSSSLIYVQGIILSTTGVAVNKMFFIFWVYTLSFSERTQSLCPWFTSPRWNSLSFFYFSLTHLLMITHYKLNQKAWTFPKERIPDWRMKALRICDLDIITRTMRQTWTTETTNCCTELWRATHVRNSLPNRATTGTHPLHAHGFRRQWLHYIILCNSQTVWLKEKCKL